jgi:hypothetical protein
MVQWVEKHLCDEQHSHPGSLRLVHLHKQWLSKLLSQCEHFTTFEC